MSRSYHHGDLRNALLDHAELEIERVGHEALELKNLAVLAGVTTGAPYRHYRNRDDLLIALADRGFTKLRDISASAAAGPGDPHDRFVAMCRAFVDFARQQPKLFRMMFMSDFMREHFDPTAAGSLAGATFGLFERAMAATMPEASARAVRAASLTCVAALQGYILLLDFAKFDMLLIDGETEDSLFIKLIAPYLRQAPVMD